MKKYVVIGIIMISIVFFLLLNSIDDGIKTNTSGLSPSELKLVSKGINYNNISYTNISEIPEEIYKRPDFYPTYKTYIDQTDKKQTDAYGYGAYPGEISYNVKAFKASDFVDVYTFVHTSYSVGNYQGLRLSLKSPDENLFETITEPSDILLSPFLSGSKEISKNWTYRIKMRITARKDIPEGRYVFKLSAGQPSPEKVEEYMKLTTNYTSAGMIQPGKFFDFVLYAYSEE
jgi:hypothetical protein